jgi:hypothetical protein
MIELQTLLLAYIVRARVRTFHALTSPAVAFSLVGDVWGNQKSYRQLHSESTLLLFAQCNYGCARQLGSADSGKTPTPTCPS